MDQKLNSRIKKYMLKNKPVYGDEFLFSPTMGQVIYWTRIINNEIFDKQIPKFRTILIKKKFADWARCYGKVDNYGIQYCDLTLRTNFRSKREFIEILIHEMVHYHEWFYTKKMYHGKYFMSWRHKIETFGAILMIEY